VKKSYSSDGTLQLEITYRFLLTYNWIVMQLWTCIKVGIKIGELWRKVARVMEDE
jgi:hypothetical protein